jgi:hypothetical protein
MERSSCAHCSRSRAPPGHGAGCAPRSPRLFAEAGPGPARPRRRGRRRGRRWWRSFLITALVASPSPIVVVVVGGRVGREAAASIRVAQSPEAPPAPRARSRLLRGAGWHRARRHGAGRHRAWRGRASRRQAP